MKKNERGAGIEAELRAAAVDRLISWAMYFGDPDGNGLEIYWDTRLEPGGRKLWNGVNHPLDSAKILQVLSAT